MLNLLVISVPLPYRQTFSDFIGALSYGPEYRPEGNALREIEIREI
jgi:hypothetical protein